MTVNPTDIGHDAVADFALLLSEAAGVLAAIAEASPEHRTAELEELHAINAEGLSSLCGIPEAATSAKAIVALPEILRTMLADVLVLGEGIAQGRWLVRADQVSAVKTMTRALSAGLDRVDDQAFVTHEANIVSACADTFRASRSERRASDPAEALVVAAARGASALHGLVDAESVQAHRPAV